MIAVMVIVWSRNHFVGNADEMRLMRPDISVTVNSKTFTMQSRCGRDLKPCLIARIVDLISMARS